MERLASTASSLLYSSYQEPPLFFEIGRSLWPAVTPLQLTVDETTPTRANVLVLQDLLQKERAALRLAGLCAAAKHPREIEIGVLAAINELTKRHLCLEASRPFEESSGLGDARAVPSGHAMSHEYQFGFPDQLEMQRLDLAEAFLRLRSRASRAECQGSAKPP
jgi:hypothetical protein